MYAMLWYVTRWAAKGRSRATRPCRKALVYLLQVIQSQLSSMGLHITIQIVSL